MRAPSFDGVLSGGRAEERRDQQPHDAEAPPLADDSRRRRQPLRRAATAATAVAPLPPAPPPLSRRVAAYTEHSLLGAAINIASSILSVVSVAIWVVESKASADDPALYARLRILDLVTAILFLCEWSFWLWLSPPGSRRRYVLSFQSWVDLATAIPMIASFALGAAGVALSRPAAAIESLCRAARILRVYRLFRLGRSVRDEATSRVLELALTVAVIVFSMSVLFFDIETNFSDAYPDLTFFDALYWAVVSLSTLGYGDYVPTVTASRLMLIGALVATFTVLPLQTSAVVSALAARSPYQRARYRPAGDGAHAVVVAPSLSGEAAERIANALLRRGSGDGKHDADAALLSAMAADSSSSSSSFPLACPPCSRVVFLCPHPPDAQLRALLKASSSAAGIVRRLFYIEGSALRPQDLERAAVGSATAVLLLAADEGRAAAADNDDPRAADLRQGAALVALGHSLQAIDRAEARQAAAHARRYAGLAAALAFGGDGNAQRLDRRLARSLAAFLVRLILAAVRARDWLLLRPTPPYVLAMRRAERAARHAAKRIGRAAGAGGGNAAASVMAAAAAAALQPPSLPRVLVQMLLPESRDVLQQMLREMQPASLTVPSRRIPARRRSLESTTGGGNGFGSSSPGRLLSSSSSVPPPLSAAPSAAVGLEGVVERASAAMLRHYHRGTQLFAAVAAPAEQQEDEAAAANNDNDDEEQQPTARTAVLRLRPVRPFWSRFASASAVVCPAELRAALLAASASPSPGAAALVANLVRPLPRVALLPPQSQQRQPRPATTTTTTSASVAVDRYLTGARSRLHALRRLPAHLSREPFARVARYAHASFGVAVVALVVARARARAEEDEDAESDDDESDDDDDDDDRLMIAPLGARRIGRRSRALVIAPDARAALTLAASPRDHYEQWRAEQQQQGEEEEREEQQRDGAASPPAASPPRAAITITKDLPPLPPLLANAQHLQGHVIICGAGTRPSVLLAAVRPLRASLGGGSLPEVVILDRRPTDADVDLSEPADAAAWRALTRHPGVFLVCGTASHADDLRKAGAATASAAVVLARGNGGGDDGQVEARALEDAEALHRARLLRSLNPALVAAGREAKGGGGGNPLSLCAVELSLPGSCLALGPFGTLLPGGGGGAGNNSSASAVLLRAATTPEHMAGGVVLSAGLGDALACAALQAGGRHAVALLARMLLLHSTRRRPTLLGDGEEEAEEAEAEEGEQRASLAQVDALEAAPGAQTYGDVFAALTRTRGSLVTGIPLGLYRRAAAPSAASSEWDAPRAWAERAAAAALRSGDGGRGAGGGAAAAAADAPRSSSSRRGAAALRYVQTNPPAHTRLERGDRVFVLLSPSPSASAAASPSPPVGPSS
jgi:voltage-gated potassium channel